MAQPPALAPSIRDGVTRQVRHTTRLVSSEDHESSGARLPPSQRSGRSLHRPFACTVARARFRTCLPSRRDRMNVAQRETLGSRARSVSPSPAGTAAGSVVPAGLRAVSACPNPALRAGLRSGRPSGTTDRLNRCRVPWADRRSARASAGCGTLKPKARA